MERIMIIGCPGSGKTTLATKLAEKLGLPLVHLDRLYWQDGWQTVPKEEFLRRLNAAVAEPRWIIDGNYGSTIPLRLARCDAVIFLDFPRMTSVAGVLKRVITNHGKSRPDMGGNCPERFDFRFLKFAWGFNRENREKYHAMLAEAEHAEVVILRNRREVDAFLRRV